MSCSQAIEKRVSEKDSRYSIHICPDNCSDYIDIIGDWAGSLYIKNYSRYYTYQPNYGETHATTKPLSLYDIWSMHYKAAISYLDTIDKPYLKSMVYGDPEIKQDYHEYWEYQFKYRYNQSYPESYREKVPSHQERISEYLLNICLDQMMDEDKLEDIIRRACTISEKSTRYSDILLIIDPEDWQKEGFKDEGQNYADSETCAIRDILDGDVYGYIITPADDEDSELDSCWGYVGWDHDKSGLIEAAEASCFWLGIQAEEKHIEALGVILEACGHS